MFNSRLTGPPLTTPEQIVAWHGAMQAQDYGPAKWSAGQRSTGLLDEDFDRSLEEGSVVRTHILRPTWHFVARDDIRWLLALTGPRVHQHNGPRYRDLGLDVRTRAQCEKAIVSALKDHGRLTRHGISEALHRAGIDGSGQRLPYILMHCELEGAICSGGLAGKQHTYVPLDDRVPQGREWDRDRALVELVRRYLISHGPATVQDLRWWSSLKVADIKDALHMLGTEVAEETIDDVTFWSLAADETQPPSARGVNLLQAYDELIVGYSQSRFFGDPLAAVARFTWKDRRLPTGVVLMNARIAGHWKRTIKEDSVIVEVLTYDDPKASTVGAIDAAAAKLGRFLGRQASVDVSPM